MSIEKFPGGLLPHHPDANKGNTEKPGAHYEREAQQVIGEDRTVEFKNLAGFEAGKKRFLFGFSESSQAEASKGFVKMVRIENNPLRSEVLYENLRREVLALEVAHQLNIPTTAIFHPYEETTGGYAVIHLEALDSAKGTVLVSPELIAAAKPEYGAWMAETMRQSAGRQIPAGVTTSSWRRIDERNASVEIFREAWQKDIGVILSSLPNDADRSHFQRIFDDTEAALEPLLDSGVTPDKEFFVHNDVSPSNVFFNEENKQAVLLDFERAGTTQHQFLAWLTDASTFYGRCWPNPEMQREFIRASMNALSPDQLEIEHTKMKSVIVFGSTFFSKFVMDPAHPEHMMGISLLKDMEANLSFLDQVYRQLSTTSEQTEGASQ